MTKPILIEFFIEADETKEVTDGGKHALADMVSNKLESTSLKGLNIGAS